MRALILVAGAALAVSACSSNESADNTMNVDENLAAENIVTDNLTVDANSVNVMTDANMTMNSDMNMDMNADMNAMNTTNAM